MWKGIETMKQPKNVLIWMTSEQQGFMANVSADFIHKNKTAEITVCAF